MFLVELTTRAGRVSERYETYAEARRRLEQFPAESILGLAFIFQQLPDGSERLVREDGKPLQFHRRLVEESQDAAAEEPLPLEEASGASLRVFEPEPPCEDPDDPLPLA